MGSEKLEFFALSDLPPYYALNCGNLAFRPVDRRPHPISGSMALTVDRGWGHQQPIGGLAISGLAILGLAVSQSVTHSLFPK